MIKSPAVYGVLQELGINEKDTLLILNKVDAIADPAKLAKLSERYPNAVQVSARTLGGVDELAAAVSAALSRSFKNVEIRMPVGNGRLLAYLAAKGEVISTSYDEEQVTVRCRLPQKYLGRITDDDVEIIPIEMDHVTEDRRFTPTEAESEEPIPASADVVVLDGEFEDQEDQVDRQDPSGKSSESSSKTDSGVAGPSSGVAEDLSQDGLA